MQDNGNKKAHSEFLMQRSVQFSEADAAGIAHFSRFFCYMEECEHAFLVSLGCTLWGGSDQVLWPRVDAQCSYLSPLALGAAFSIQLYIVELRDKSIHYQFQFHTGADQRLCAVGQLSVLAASIDEQQQQLRACSLPRALREQIETAPEDVLYKG